LEDVEGERYSPGEPEHRRLAARWLATVQLHGTEIFEASPLPDRGPRHYLVHLLQARGEIARQLRRPQEDPDAERVLEDLLSKLDALESRWDDLDAFCSSLPQTFVHGDFVSRNLRITGAGRETGLAIFDWETAGLGVQAPDLAQLVEPERSAIEGTTRSKRFYRFSANPCLDTYRSLLTGSAAALDAETVETSAAVGNLFRCIAGIDWTCSQATNTWCPVDDLRVFAEWLGSAMEFAGWSSPATAPLRAVG
jgi:aminoglycoside phosphotransferase (APT) family kinase protein